MSKLATPTRGDDLVRLAHRDPEEAARRLRALPHLEQAHRICDAPIAERAALLSVIDDADAVIPLLPEAELCFTLKAIGLHDAGWIVEHASKDQVRSCLDLDAWSEFAPDLDGVDKWMRCFAGASDETLLKCVDTLDPELIVLWLQSRLSVHKRDVQAAEYQAPIGSKTLDGVHHLLAHDDNDDLSLPLRLLTLLFEADRLHYERLVLGVEHEPQTENEEWALRWREGRLLDLGFPPWRETLGVYSPVRGSDLEAPPVRSTEFEGWTLPIYAPNLPTARDSNYAIFLAAADFSDEERGQLFYAYLSLANHLAVADHAPLGDAESVPAAMEKAAAVASRGLLALAERRGEDPAALLRRVPLLFLFRVGYSLDRATL